MESMIERDHEGNLTFTIRLPQRDLRDAQLDHVERAMLSMRQEKASDILLGLEAVFRRLEEKENCG